MAHYLFENIEEVEVSTIKEAPSFVYKYRGDWNNKFHKELITHQSAWFASPRELNDPYDITTPLQFDYSEVEDPIFFEKLKLIFRRENPNLSDKYISDICTNKLNEIRINPQAYFKKNYIDLKESGVYDRIGIFSCTTDELNETMWAHYGNNSKGFVVGFRTIELLKSFLSSAGSVKYSDEVPKFSFINPGIDADFDNYYLKSTKWSYEKEFRFSTINDDTNLNREKKFSIESVSEFLIGNNFPENQIDDFIHQVQSIYPKGIPIYQVIPKVSEFGLEKTRVF